MASVLKKSIGGLLGFLAFGNTLSAEVVGIVGGGTSGSGKGNAFLVDNSGTTIFIDHLPSNSSINSVAMNNASLSVIGGVIGNHHNYGAVVDASGTVTQFSNPLISMSLVVKPSPLGGIVFSI